MKTNPMVKRVLSLFVLVTLLLSLFVACSRDDSLDSNIPERHQRNLQIPCSQNWYSINEEYLYLYGFTCLTETTPQVGSVDSYRRYELASSILSDYEEYLALLEFIAKKADSSYIGSYPAVNVSADFPAVISGAAGISEEFFVDQQLLMVDFLYEDAQPLYPRLDNLVISGNHVTVDLQYGTLCSSAAGNDGVVYFIPIPKNCETSEVNLVHVPQWDKSGNPLD